MSRNACCVAGCVKVKGEKLSYHEFPTNPERRAKWFDRVRSICIRRKGFSNKPPNVDHLCVCSKHFLLSDYKQGLTRNILMPFAIPSQCLTFPRPPKVLSTYIKKREQINKLHESSQRDSRADSEEIQYFDVDIDADSLVSLDEDLDIDVPRKHVTSAATQTLGIECNSVAVQVDVDGSNYSKRQIQHLQARYAQLEQKCRALTRELEEERKNSFLQKKVIEKLKRGPTLFPKPKIMKAKVKKPKVKN